MSARVTLKGSLLLAITVLVVGSTLLVAVLASQRYGASLRQAMTAQSRIQAHSLALQAADPALTNDLVGLQRLFDQQRAAHPDIAYVFMLRDERVLAHTFAQGLPIGLIEANVVPEEGQDSIREIAAQDGRLLLDLAVPVFEGRAGVLRVGFYEGLLEHRMRELWVDIALVTSGILAVAVLGGLFFVRRITRPLARLIDGFKAVEGGQPEVRVTADDYEELHALTDSFNGMAERVAEYTARLERQALDLDRAHHQMRTSCEIAKQAGSLGRSQEIASFLIDKLRQILPCQAMGLIVTPPGEAAYVLSERSLLRVHTATTLEKLHRAIDNLPEDRISKDVDLLPSSLLPIECGPNCLQSAMPMLNEGRRVGALAVACSGGCSCTPDEHQVVRLVLSHTSGMLLRAVRHEEDMRRLSGDREQKFFQGLMGRSPAMQGIYRLIENVAGSDATVLIQGESGTGKELAARAVHDLSPRRDKPFVVINCSAYPETLLESELFGHEKGAFTGAIKQRLGRFEQADGGTVFLDEIGEIPAASQVKLLRVLQSQTFERLGGEKTISVDVRVLAATNRDLLDEVREGRFREDLYYRLDVVSLRMPPLRERGNDVSLLANHFLEAYAAEHGKVIDGFSTAAMKLLLDYDWPGNVRELQNVVEQATVLCSGGQITPEHLPTRLSEAMAASAPRRTLQTHERDVLVETLERCGWNKKLAAETLGISRSALYAKIKRYAIETPAA